MNATEIVKTFIATWNKHDANATNKLLDADVVFQSPLFSSPVRGIAEYATVDENFLTSMPDFEFNVLRVAADGDFVATELVGTGTSTGPAKIAGRDLIPPAGRVEFGLAGFFRVTPDGLIAEERYYYDRLDFLQQLNPAS